MKNNLKAKDIDVVILCGGKGERLQIIVNDRPKPLVEINGRPFLDILIDYVAGFGFKRFILCIGYKADLIKRYYKDKKSSLEIIFSEEKQPLGTAGAIKNAESVIRSNPFLVMNGDSFCQLDINKFVNFHITKKALFSLILVEAKESEGYGVVRLGDSQQVIAFDEKTKAKPHEFINAGIYLLADSVLSMTPANKKLSLEYDVFPKIVNERFFGYATKAGLIDIGIPERYKEAKLILRDFCEQKAGLKE